MHGGSVKRDPSDTELGIELETLCGRALLNSLPSRERSRIEETVKRRFDRR